MPDARLYLGLGLAPPMTKRQLLNLIFQSLRKNTQRQIHKVKQYILQLIKQCLNYAVGVSRISNDPGLSISLLDFDQVDCMLVIHSVQKT